MVVLNFSVFKEKLVSGEKQQTIRKNRVTNPIEPGTSLQIYWKQRSPNRIKLFDAECVGTKKVDINSELRLVWVNLQCLTDDQVQVFAEADGFESVDEFFNFFAKKYGTIFNGKLIRFKRRK